MSQKTIILAFHGSRRSSSQKEAEALTASVCQSRLPFKVVLGFLQFSAPSLESVINDEISQGTNEMTIFPVFSLTGAHVEKDIPDLVSSISSVNPQVKIKVLPHLCGLPSFHRWLETALQELV